MYAVLFDIDGTLIQTGGAGQLAFAQAFRDEFGVTSLSCDVPFAGRSDRAIACDLMRVHDVEPHVENWNRFRAAYLQRLPSALQHRQGRVLPGVGDFLAALAGATDVAVGLLTGNISEGAKAKLAYYELAQHFPFGGFGDEATDRADIAAAALAEAKRHVIDQAEAVGSSNGNGANPLRGAMVIGDTVHDIRCARAIGAFAVGVPTGQTSAETLADESPDLLLDDLGDFAQLLEIARA